MKPLAYWFSIMATSRAQALASFILFFNFSSMSCQLHAHLSFQILGYNSLPSLQKNNIKQLGAATLETYVIYHVVGSLALTNFILQLPS